MPNNEGWRRKYDELGISYKQSDDMIYIEGFVSGDTEENGLSVVSLDNPLYCMYHSSSWETTETIETREMIWRGYDSWIVTHSGSGGSPTCPY